MPQEIKKIPIVIASTLKPVDDTRMLEKLATTIGKRKKFDITIIGYPTKNSHLPDGITFIPFKPFKRLSIGRLTARFTFLKHVLAVRPSIIIVTTHELLFTSLIAKWRVGCRLIYDIQENYYLNILHSNTFSALIKHAVASLVRLKERVIGPFIDHFLLAERAYSTELGFLSNRFTILENRVSKQAVDACSFEKKSKVDGTIHLLFSGTLAKETGVFEAIRWTKSFYKIDPRFRLTIIGYCARKDVLLKIQKEIKGHDYISLIGGDELVPHSQLMEETSKSDGGFITYQINPSTAGSMPTKLYEYIALQLPVLLVPHPLWVAYCAPHQAAIVLDDLRSPEQLVSTFTKGDFYAEPQRQFYWEDQEDILLGVIDPK